MCRFEFTIQCRSLCAVISNRTQANAAALEARFVRDVTVRDGSVLAPGAKFVKIWTLRNSGRAPWPAGCRLTFVGGDALAEAPSSDALPAVAVDQEINVALDMTAPAAPGRYTSFWRFVTPDGAARFGHRVWCSVHVALDGPDCVADEPLVAAAPAAVASAAPVGAAAAAAVAAVAAAHDDEMLSHIERSFHKVNEATQAIDKACQAAAADKAAADKAAATLLFSSQQRQLANMGFVDAERNAALLMRHSGDVLAAVQSLLADDN